MKSQKYIVRKTLGLDFLSTLDLNSTEGTFEGVKFIYDPEKVKTFLRTCDCIACGLKGSVVRLEKLSGCSHAVFGATHLNVWGSTPNGQNILMTVDHAELQSLGGSDVSENYNTMCVHCNKRRSNKYPVLQDFLKLYDGVSTVQYWENLDRIYELNKIRNDERKAKRKAERVSNVKVSKEEYLSGMMFNHVGDYNRHMKKLKKELTESKR